MGLQTLILINGRDNLHTLGGTHIGRTHGKRLDEQLQNDHILAGLQSKNDMTVGIHHLDLGVGQQIAHHHHLAGEGFEHLRELVLSLGREGANGVEQLETLLLLIAEFHHLDQLRRLLIGCEARLQ